MSWCIKDFIDFYPFLSLIIVGQIMRPWIILLAILAMLPLDKPDIVHFDLDNDLSVTCQAY